MFCLRALFKPFETFQLESFLKSHLHILHMVALFPFNRIIELKFFPANIIKGEIPALLMFTHISK